MSTTPPTLPTPPRSDKDAARRQGANPSNPKPNPRPAPRYSVAAAAAAWGQASVTGTTKAVHDANGFYVKATDVKGHGEKLGFKIPPDVFAQIQVIVHSGEFPDYSQPADFVRDAIVHHLERRRSQVGDPSMRDSLATLLDRLRFKEFIEQAAQQTVDWQTMQERMRETLTGLQRDGAYDHMTELLDESEQYADPIAEPYRTQVMETVKEWRQKVSAATKK